MSNKKTFLSDVKTLRARARKNLGDGAIGSNYVGDVKKTIDILQSVLATEIVCSLRYTSTPSPPTASPAKASRRSSPNMPRTNRAT